ncbi:MAG: RNaseH domain-containing protein [Symbiobacterium sp.]|uniref:RNaseH domain-containing protein n=1 Tax=Symbiobacterium sp. TaxID=1971213 RepID=UPI003464D3ED
MRATTAFNLEQGGRSLYLSRNATWLDGEARLPVFVPITIQHRWTPGPAGWQAETGWGDALMAAVLSDLSLSPLPDVGDILGNLERARQEGIDGFVAALVHPPQENGHRVRPGLGVADLAQLFDSISKAVPFLVPVEPSPRNKLGNATRKNRLRKWTDIGVDERHKAVLATCAEPPTIRLFWQTEAMRDAVTEALNREFGGAIVVTPVQFGELGRRLELQDGSRSAQWAAVKRRAEEVAAAVTGEAHGAVVELQWDRQGGHTSPADPKAAIRLGLARVGMASQFLQPPDEEQKELVTAENHRVTGAVRDLMRQLGILLDWPRPVLRGEAVAGTSLVGLTTIRKSTGRRGRRRYDTAYLPVMVWMSTTDSRILVHYPGASGWATYREAATQLAVAAETDWYDNPAAVHHWLQERLLQDILPEGRTLLLVDGYRTRNWWGWMTNTAVTVDDLKFGDRKQLWAPVNDPLWENLRIVRILSGDSEETAQWFGTDDEERVGVPHGLFRLSERTFLSAQEIPGATKKFLRPSDSKLDKPGKQGWLPRLMEAVVLLNTPGEDPAQWAAVAHHLRIMASHHREALMLPLPLHLATCLEEYVLPLPEEDQD